MRSCHRLVRSHTIDLTTCRPRSATFKRASQLSSGGIFIFNGRPKKQKDKQTKEVKNNLSKIKRYIYRSKSITLCIILTIVLRQLGPLTNLLFGGTSVLSVRAAAADVFRCGALHGLHVRLVDEARTAVRHLHVVGCCHDRGVDSHRAVAVGQAPCNGSRKKRLMTGFHPPTCYIYLSSPHSVATFLMDC